MTQPAPQAAGTGCHPDDPAQDCPVHGPPGAIPPGFASQAGCNGPGPHRRVMAAEPEIQAAVALADTPTGQKVAIMITVLCGKDSAAAIAKGIEQAAAAMSSTGLIAAQNGAVPKVSG